MKSKLPFIHKGESGDMDFAIRLRKATPLFLYLITAGVLVIFLVMISRLFQLTIVKGAYYAELSENNRIREIVIEAQRGKLMDRKGLILAKNTPVEVSESLKRINSSRTYFDGPEFAHIIGYRQIADEKDIKQDSCLSKLHPNDKTGKKGAEKLFECDLRGKNGKKLIEVNAAGNFKRTLNVLDPVAGKDITLSIDGDLHKRAYEMLQGQVGSVVGLDPRTGEILVMASSPSYNPQTFEDQDSKKISELLTSEEKPMYNRAIEGTYAPGSVFKPIVAIAGLEEKKIFADTIVEDTGKVTLGNREFGTWNFLEHGRVEGSIDLVKSLARSNDIYYYKISEKIGPESIKKWAEKFGLGSISGFGFPESPGSVPSPFWKKDVLKEQWYTGDSYNFSIGQGYLLTTPMQMAVATEPFATNGVLCKPTIRKIDGTFSVPNCKKLPVSADNLKLVREGLHQACKVGGTGWPFFNFRVKNTQMPSPTQVKVGSQSAALLEAGVTLSPSASTSQTLPIEKLWDASYLLASPEASLAAYTTKVEVGCKTGTAETGGNKKPHAWFTVFAPFTNPEIVFVIMLEENGQGSDRAAPVARELLRLYFERLQ